ncbi:MAG: SLC13 family permease [Ichthyobacteriaceae bacterium]|nr:SLC13 family permease [Ichthyobacteriaceae bacterium]
MFDYDIHKIILLLVLVAIVVFMVMDKVKPSLVFAVGIVTLITTGTITTNNYMNGLANQSVMSIFLLIFITVGIRRNFDIMSFFDSLFGTHNSRLSFVFKLTSSVAIMSSFMNNTPIVAMMIPYVSKTAKRYGVSPSKLLLPLSFAAILGGMITVIGTSTNLVLNGMLIANNEPPFKFSDFFIPGILVTGVGVLYMSIFSGKLLPNNPTAITEIKRKKKEYFIETRLVENSISIGKTVRDAQLRNLPGVYLLEILRGKKLITPVSPNEVLEADDCLIFVGNTNKVIDLLNHRKDLVYSKSTDDVELEKLNIIEVVIPVNSSLNGKTIKKSNFRNNFDSTVIGVHRNGENLSGKIGDITLKYGDLLLMVIGKYFSDKTDNNKDLYIVSMLPKKVYSSKKRKQWFFIFSTILMIISYFLSIPLIEILMLIVVLMFLFKFLTIDEIKQNFDLHLLIILASAITLGKALIDTGLSNDIVVIYNSLFYSYGSYTMLIGLYFLTLILTSFVTNIAAVSITFPLAYSIVQELNIDGTPFYLAIAFAASAAFLTPVSYQTNLMVYGPGSYNFRNFIKFGTPMAIIYSITILLFIALKYNLL